MYGFQCLCIFSPWIQDLAFIGTMSMKTFCPILSHHLCSVCFFHYKYSTKLLWTLSSLPVAPVWPWLSPSTDLTPLPQPPISRLQTNLQRNSRPIVISPLLRRSFSAQPLSRLEGAGRAQSRRDAAVPLVRLNLLKSASSGVSCASQCVIPAH